MLTTKHGSLDKLGMTDHFYDVIIIGGGFAGVSAAVQLANKNYKIALLEKRPFLGGRAYSFTEAKTKMTVDNGQHLMMGCYHETIKLLEILGTRHLLQLQNQLTVPLATSQNLFLLKCKNFPGQLHLLSGLLGLTAFSIKEKFNLIRMLLKIKKLRGPLDIWDNTNCETFLQQQHQSTHSISVFWEPFILATLNQTPAHASAALLIAVLKQALLGSKQDALLAFATTGLSNLFADAASSYLKSKSVDIFYQTQMQSLKNTTDGWQLLSTQQNLFAAKNIILAVPPTALLKMDIPTELKKDLHQIKSSPILSINLWIKDWQLPQDFCGLITSPLHWVFNKAKLVKSNANYLSCLISACEDIIHLSNEDLVKMAIQELQKYFSDFNSANIYHSQVIREREATYGNAINSWQLRPQQQTNLPGIYLAGDWTQTELPSTIESAVKSGVLAAKQLMRCVNPIN